MNDNSECQNFSYADGQVVNGRTICCAEEKSLVPCGAYSVKGGTGAITTAARAPKQR